MPTSSASFAVRVTAAIKKLTKRQKLWFAFLVVFFIFTIVGLIGETNVLALVELPAAGGELREGIIGTSGFINPLLAVTNPDRDLTALIYSGLVRYSKSGTLVPDLAERYEISTDGKEYRFFLKPNLVWHDGEPVTAEDVIFTFKSAKDPSLKSPRRAAWEGVEIARKNDQEIIFTLKQPYAPFLENLTLGLLPAHLWREIPAENFSLHKLNLTPIGTGPYKIKKIVRDNNNIPTAYELTAFKYFALGEPRLATLIINLYSNENELLNAYETGAIESLSAVSPATVKNSINTRTTLATAPLPRIFAVFFNQNQTKIFAQTEVREALNGVVNRQEIIDQVLGGYGRPAYGPLPLGPFTTGKTETETATTSAALLTKHGWVKNSETKIWEQKTKTGTTTLAFTLSTSDIAELKATAEILKNTWEKFGAKVEVKIFETGALNQNVIRPREYEALLFGEIVSHESDLYSFWHSRERLDPGLNIALYTNAKVDKMLEDLRGMQDSAKRQEISKQAAEEIVKDRSAVFLYSPDFLYLLPQTIKGAAFKLINTPDDRFSNIYQWFINTEKIWSIFQ